MQENKMGRCRLASELSQVRKFGLGLLQTELPEREIGKESWWRCIETRLKTLSQMESENLP